MCFSYFWGGDDGCGRLLPSMGVRLAFDAGEVWHLAGEKRGAEVFLKSHHRGNPRWRPFMSKDPSPTSDSFAQISLL